MRGNDLTRLPEIIVAGKPLSAFSAPNAEALGTALTGGASSLGRILTAQVEVSNHTTEGLIYFLNTRTATARRACDRSKYWWGRLYNKMTGERPLYVPLSGHHLIQVLRALGRVQEAETIPQYANCGIRVDISELYLEELIARHSANSAPVPSGKNRAL